MGKMFFALLAVMLLAGCSQQPVQNPQQQGAQVQQKQVLTVYTYDSMVSEYGLGPKVVPKFEEKCGCKVNMVSKGDAGQVVAALKLEKNNTKADVVIGIDNSLLSRAVQAGVLEKFTPRNISLVPEALRFDADGYLTPYDYGYFAFIYDADKIDFPLGSFNAMLDSRLKNSIAIQNPRTSSPGLGLLLWTVSVYGDPGYREFWKEFRKNVLTVTDTWDKSAGLFAAKEVPIYFSYTTSPPYYVLFEDNNHFLAASFEEGHYAQIEGMGIVKGAKQKKLAQDFIEFSLGEDFQKEIPLNQYMLPVNNAVALPEAFEKYAPMPAKKLELNPALVEEKQEGWISEWEKIMVSG